MSPTSDVPRAAPDRVDAAKASKRSSGRLYLAVLVAVTLGALLGVVSPARAVAMKPLGDAFVRALKMLIAPIVFATVATGVAGAGDMKKVGRVGAKALLYFEAMTTLALALGLAVVHLVKPGAGIHASAAALDGAAIAAQTKGREAKSFVAHLMDIIPESTVSAFTSGEVLQVLFLAVLTGVALVRLGERGKPATRALEQLAHVSFELVLLLMR
ncbi:MAG: cation:dicarboxylase symporter family transporter, partial [Deltaproteobacteria bacterium]|nr:cation:dicarboxylase symporter family transporter [Deltaproteobacteria bacterium]